MVSIAFVIGTQSGAPKITLHKAAAALSLQASSYECSNICLKAIIIF